MVQTRLAVSVIVPTYNRADLLPQAIDCLLGQTRVPDEIIVVDDGSTDHTQEVLAGYGSAVIAIHQANRGEAGSRNTGLRQAKGDVIAFLDSDDLLPLNSLQRRVEYLEAHPEIKAVYTAAYLTDMQGNVMRWFRKPPLPQGFIFDEMVCRTVFPVHTVMFHRSCLDTIGYMDEALRVQDDFDYWIRFSAVYPFAAIDESLAYYRVHNQMSIIRQADGIVENGILVQRRAFDMEAFQQLTPAQQARVYSIHGTQYAILGRMKEARSWYRTATKTAPNYLRPRMLYFLTFSGRTLFNGIANALRRRAEGKLASITPSVEHNLP